MKISTEIGSAARLVGEEKAVELVALAGFDAWDFSMQSMARDWPWRPSAEHPLRLDGYAAFARELRKIGEACGIHCNQSHAPFPVARPDIRSYLKRCIECTAIAGGEICVIHPNNNKCAEENAEMYFELLPFAKECGVKIATENMFCWEKEAEHATPAACSDPADFVAHLDAVNDPFFVACLDIGHAEMRGLCTSAPAMIRALGSRLFALHLHDNDKWHDKHQNLFTGEINLSAVLRALREVGYAGYFTMEANTHLSTRGTGKEGVLPGLREMAEAARRFAAMYEEM